MAADIVFAGYASYILERTHSVLLPAAALAANDKIHKRSPRGYFAQPRGDLFGQVILRFCYTVPTTRRTAVPGCVSHSPVVGSWV